MAISFTPEQQQVIQLHDRNILVSAAAGSGKTAVLVERIIRMICDETHRVDIDRLLIVTFTNAAAAEMRERIAAGISDRLSLHPESEHLQRQSTLLHNAQITTIDSFSLFLLRNHFNEIGLDPAFRVADEGEIKLMQQDVLAELLEDSFASGDKGFLACVEYFCPGGRERVLEQHILQLSRYAASFPWPSEWLADRKKDYSAADVQTLMESDYGQYLSKHVKRMVAGCVEKLRQMQAICESSDGPYMYGELIEKEREQLEQLLLCDSLEEFATRIPTVSFGRLPSKKDDSVSQSKRELVKDMRTDVKKILQDMTEKFFLTPLPLALQQGQACIAPVGTLIELVLEFDRRMQEKKQEKKLVDFSDMEHFALDILLEKVEDEQGKVQVRPSAVAKEYREYFHEILIDEYQDSNLVQEYLLWAVSGEEDGHYNRFMVGDVKQSIYKFRLARPELFLEKYDTYLCDKEDSQTSNIRCRRIDLSKNFRSRAEVVDAVNQVFSRMMSKEIGGIAYDEAAALYAGAVYPANEGCGSELLLVEKPEGKSGKQAEALAIAHKIKELRATYQVTDKATGELRPAKYSDMVILLRTNSGWDEEFKEVLTQQGIPVYITSKTGYFAATEVQELLQLLRVLDNPRQDIPLCGVMRSIFGNFGDEEIAAVRAGRKKMSLYEALQDYAGGENSGREETDTLVEKVRSFLTKIEYYRSYTVYMPIRELLQTLVDEYDYLNYVTALPAGSKRRANVEMLFTKASDFEKTSYFGLFHFIRYIEQLEKYDVDFGEADILDENADVVRIMSIHKSKGLEFAITFVAGLGKRFNMQDVNASLLVDMDMGLGTDYVNAERRIRNKTLRRVILSRKMREDNLAEELRVLYVALTRAKEKLIMTAALEQAAEKWEAYKELDTPKLSYLDFMEATGYLDFLLPILPQTGITVSVLDREELAGETLTEALQAMDRRVALAQAKELADVKLLAQLQERFAYRYAFQGLEKLYTKTTVSELKIAAMADADEEAFHTFEEKEIVPYIPTFKREEGKVSGTVRGNAFHRAMELLDFNRLLEEPLCGLPGDYDTYRQRLEGEALEAVREKLRIFLQEKTDDLKLSQEYYDALNEKKLLRFLQSEIAFRMWSADRRGEFYREQPFVYGVSAGRLREEFPAEETVLIQGIIDGFFV
ncbi:MAG: helicase-exonuclease AddAB subunit AddA [Lachnospiraceae bacterium]|nr:helicase-exonuclease AddAB subunit AddA [Lachnospiraceae bacterium]